jgi:photosystem II stability/assembly factor-like uncharacterized protein
MGADEESASVGSGASRARRAKALSVLSLAVVAVAAAVYIRPTLQPAALASPRPAAAPGFQIEAVDFVNATTGWVVADLDNARFRVLATIDGGMHWRSVLTETSSRPGEYLRFFDPQNGVVVTPGSDPAIYSTANGGATWTLHTVFSPNAFVLSASFADRLHGWVLIDPQWGVPLSAVGLMRTQDGGATWTWLGEDFTTAVQPFAVAFTDAEHGWLDAVAPAPVAYATSDGGASWRPIALPTPRGGWPVPSGWYFVAVRPTVAGGLIASVVNAAHVNGRDASGAAVLNYPPLTVRAYDGGSAVVYVYSTLADSAFAGINAESRPGPFGAIPPAAQVLMSSLDDGLSWRAASAPSAGGTLGFASALDWWWIGPGKVATSGDAGASWSAVEDGKIEQPVAGSLVVVDAAHAWLIALVKSAPILFSTADSGGHWSVVKLPAVSP